MAIDVLQLQTLLQFCFLLDHDHHFQYHKCLKIKHYEKQCNRKKYFTIKVPWGTLIWFWDCSILQNTSQRWWSFVLLNSWSVPLLKILYRQEKRKRSLVSYLERSFPMAGLQCSSGFKSFPAVRITNRDKQGNIFILLLMSDKLCVSEQSFNICFS